MVNLQNCKISFHWLKLLKWLNYLNCPKGQMHKQLSGENSETVEIAQSILNSLSR